MKVRILCIGFALALTALPGIASTSMAQDAGAATVAVEELTVYSRASTNAEPVHSLTKGTSVFVDLELNDWCGISDAGGMYLGYVECPSLKRAPRAIKSWSRTGPASPAASLRPYSDIKAELYMTVW